MISWKLRPSFRQELDLGSDEAQNRIVRHVQRDHSNFEIKSFPGFVCLRIPKEDRHFWTPRLNVSLEQTESGGTQVRGTFGPNANVWALYLYGYLIVGIVGMFSGMFGACQLFVGLSAWGLWVFSGSLVIALALYLASRIGQRIAMPQSKLLERIYVEAVGQEVRIR
ncbi:hypothetical protein [Pelagicoccus sp. SDUM812003]|uniref:hypothetical protein n=1 Tax=Pelagicoccus sp. SDUM812003 TaxID=3041267 RepID=UPI00280EC337|nr:hypothetical protein [Pelagicoccus sp. SDUM812003]MDQ8201826.1 hypothetical protein [Pelagicoccus sp. SDUM812003]